MADEDSTEYMPKRLIGYARISRTSHESTSIEKQKQLILDEVKRRGDELVRIEVDENISALKKGLNRPGLDRARQAVADDEADGIIVWKLDRIARSVVDLGTLLDGGLRIVSINERHIDMTSNHGRLMVDIMQVFSGFEAKTTGERLRNTKAFLKSMRRWGGGPRPYGYTPVKAEDGIGKVLHIEEKEAEVIRRIFRDLLDGVPVNALARTLNAEGIPTVKDGQWKPASIINIARAFHVSGYLTEQVNKGSRERRPVTDSEGNPVRAWEPIVDDETAEAVRALVTREAIDAARSEATKAGIKAPRPLLHGLAFCPCGEALIRRTRKGREFYGCRGLAEGKHVLVDAAQVDQEAERQFLRSFAGAKVTERTIEVSASRALAEIDANNEQLLQQVRTSNPSDLPALFARITALSEERERIEQAGDRVTVRTSEETYGDAWQAWTTEERREHMAALGVRVAIRHAHQRGVWDPWRVRLTTDYDYLAGFDDE